MQSKQQQFIDLVTRVQNCSLCPRMNDRKRVLSSTNGSLDSVIVFIAEAPGRLGADMYGIPLYGDQTGRNFEFLLTNAGLKRDEIFITNAILCNPRTSSGYNDSPNLSEIRNCSSFLRNTLEIIKPEYVAPLGTKALSALNVITKHQITLASGVGKLFNWNGYQVYPLYHPGPRAMIWRDKAEQMRDYGILADVIFKNSINGKSHYEVIKTE